MSALPPLLQVGKGKVVGQKVLMSWKDPKPHVAVNVGLKTGWGADGRWRIYSSQAPGCTDINDCTAMPCGTNSGVDFSTCTDKGANKYSCTCPSGYTAPATGGKCAVSNKCTSGENDCSGAGSLSCKDYTTFNNQRYVMRNIPLAPSKEIVFSVKAKNDAHIGFFDDRKNYNNGCYEIVLSGWGNKRSQIRDRNNAGGKGTRVDLATPKLLDNKKFLDFWASAKNGLVQVGKGRKVGLNVMMSWKDPKPLKAKWVGLKTGWGSAGAWNLCSFPTTGNFATCNHGGTAAKPTHTCTCNAGFFGNGKTGKGGTGCQDKDGCKGVRCALLGGSANKRVKCTDAKAPAQGFTCGKCPSGYDAVAVGMVKGQGGKCVDTDGCKTSPCGANRDCFDKKAPTTGYTCGPCSSGYKQSGKNCVDIDDCTASGNPCGKGSTKCTNQARHSPHARNTISTTMPRFVAWGLFTTTIFYLFHLDMI